MKLEAEIDGEIHKIELMRDGGSVTAVVDGREFHVDVSQPEPNVYLLKRDGTVFEARVAPDGSVKVKGLEFQINVIDPKQLRTGSSSGSDAGGAAEIRTAMPGKIVRVLAGVGDTVSKGDPVIVVEAMKMQNELAAPKDGTIVAVHVQEASTVAAGDVLVSIE